MRSTLARFVPLSLDDKERVRREIIASCELVADCWIYPVTNSAGYGVKRIGGRVQTTSRFMLAYETRESMTLDHDACHTPGCPYRACCNPSHLQWGSHAINAKQREADKREQRKRDVVVPPVPLGHITHAENALL
jgi:hypothetical protein